MTNPPRSHPTGGVHAGLPDRRLQAVRHSDMGRITLIGSGHPAANPRLVRDADALAAAGHTVRVLGVNFVPRLADLDEGLLRGRAWRYEAVDCLRRWGGRVRWQISRLRRRVSRAVSDRVAWSFADDRAYGYVIPELVRLAKRDRADMYIAHQHVTLPVAARAADRWHCPFGFDAEDLLADCPDEPVGLVRRYEQAYLPNCAYVSTMSEAAADRLAESNRLQRRPLVLHNTPWLAERAGLASPSARPNNDVPSVYWFGQTVGPHSCAEQVIRALPLLGRPLRFVMRGNPREQYVARLDELARGLGVSHLVEIAQAAPPGEMVRLAAEHDLLMGSQPGQDLFHLMAIGNKVFTGMMAGLALALTDTAAHRRLMADVPGTGFLFPEGPPAALAEQLRLLLEQPGRLRECQQRCWEFAERRYNWDTESDNLVREVDHVLAGSRARGPV